MNVPDNRLNETYRELVAAVTALLDGETDYVANAANLSAYVFANLPDINWIGFYFLRNGELVVGPFAGQPACTRIAIGRGVCGTAVAEQRTQLVHDVHEFDGHIVCDPLSHSEVVVPLFLNGSIIGVLDVDSATLARFDEHDATGIEALAQAYVSSLGSRFSGPS